MPSCRDLLLSLVDYMAWADKEILQACSALSHDELSGDLCISHGGILGTLQHMFVAEYDWIIRMRHSLASPDQEVEPQLLYPCTASGPALQELQKQWAHVWLDWREFVEKLREADLEAEFLAMGLRVSRRKLVQHVVNHATLHRGQVAGMLRQLGRQPPCTDLLEYYRLHST